MLPRPLDANLWGAACQHVVPVCGLLNVICMSFGRVVECGRAECA